MNKLEWINPYIANYDRTVIRYATNFLPGDILSGTLNLATLWTSGAYTYDGAGNVKKVGTNYYLYDKKGRLIEGTAKYASPTSHKLQRQTHDPYGNITSMTTVVNGSATAYTVIGVTPETNRLCSGAACPTSNIGAVAYDEAGNQTTYGPEGLIWDSQGMLSSYFATSSAWNYFYTASDERIWSENFASSTGVWTLRDRSVASREWSLRWFWWSSRRPMVTSCPMTSIVIGMLNTLSTRRGAIPANIWSRTESYLAIATEG